MNRNLKIPYIVIAIAFRVVGIVCFVLCPIVPGVFSPIEFQNGYKYEFFHQPYISWKLLAVGLVCYAMAAIIESLDRIVFLLEKRANEDLARELAATSPPPIPAPNPAHIKYYFTDGTSEEKQGPVEESDLHAMHRDGIIHDNTPICQQGGQAWREFSNMFLLEK